MGATLMGLVLTHWTHITDRAFRVLTRMAVTALDHPTPQTPAATYFAGRDLLVSVLRREGDGTPESAYRTVKRALDELIKEGAIERIEIGRGGRNSVYRLHLWARPAIDEPLFQLDYQGDSSSPPEGDSGCPPQGDTRSPSRGTLGVPPRNQEEPLEERSEDTGVDLRGQLTDARADQPSEDHELKKGECGQDGCVYGSIIIDGKMSYCPRCKERTTGE